MPGTGKTILRKPMARIGTEDMELIGDRSFTIAVPIDADPEFKKFVFAGAKTYVLGNVSIDYVLKRYGNSWKDFKIDPESEAGKFNNILKDIKDNVVSQMRKIADAAENISGLGPEASTAALVRIVSTFRAAIQLIRLNMPFESNAVMRLGFEQISWANAVFKLRDDSTFKIMPTKTIGKLKAVVPYSGKLYGALSDWAHMHPKFTDIYHEVIDDTHHVMLESLNLAKESILFLAFLQDAYFVISEFLFRKSLSPLSHINENDGSLIHQRPSIALIRENWSFFPEETRSQWESYLI